MGKLIPLRQLCAEGFASRPSELLLTAVDNGWALAIDAKGRVGVDATVVDRLRQQRREQEAREAREQELARQQRQDAAVADVVGAAEQEQLRARMRHIEEKVGPIWALQAEMAKAEALQPGYRSVDEHSSIAARVYTIDEVEAFAAREYSLDLSA